MSNRRTGKIARLPKDIRDVVNLMLRDGAPYGKVIEKLTGMGHAGVSDANMTAWVQGGYLDWTAEQDRLEDMKAKREFAFDIVAQNQGSKLHEAGMQLAASQLYELLSGFDLQPLKALLETKPENYAAIVNALTKLSKGALDVEKYRNAMAKANQELQKLRDPKADMTETERNAVLDKVDEILGLK